MNEFVSKLKGAALRIKCTWVRTFAYPVLDKGVCIRSYDIPFLQLQDSKDYVIGYATGNISTDDAGVEWIEATLLHCDRMDTGWFRLSDIDVDYKSSTQKKTVDLLKWVTAGITVLNILK